MIDVKTIEEAHADCDPAVCDVQPIIAERDALKAELATVRWDRECLQKRRDELETDNELLRADACKRDDLVEQVRTMHADIERLRAEFHDADQAAIERSGELSVAEARLTELREATEVVNNSILEGDWTSDAWRYAIEHMRGVLAKVAK